MDILALHLSPRKKGNSEVMLDEFLRGAHESGATSTVFSVSDHNVKPCIGCGACEKTGQCVIKDDAMAELYPLLATAPMVVVSTPLYFYDVPAQGKALIDRSQALWSRRYSLKETATIRPEGQGVLLALGATKGKDLFMPVSLSVRYFFDAIGFPKEFDKHFYRHLEAVGDWEKFPELLQEVYEAGLAFGRKRPGA